MLMNIMFSNSLDPANPINYRDILLDMRGEMLVKMMQIIAGFALIGAYLTLLEKPFPVQKCALFLSVALMVYAGFRVSRWYPNTARYGLVVMLHFYLFMTAFLFQQTWVMYLSIPLILLSGLLVSNSSILSAIAIGGIFTLMNTLGIVEVPLDVLYLLVAIMSAMTLTTISTFYVTLSWYSVMHRRADALLQESRDRRAELLSILKSLDTAYVTQQRMHEQLVYARQQANEARRAKERFAANISHELRTPLNLILGFSEIMYLTPEVYSETHFPPKFVRDIHQIYRNSKHLLELIDDILDLSHIEMSGFTLNFERTDMNEFMADAIHLMQNLFRDTTVSLQLEIEPDLPEMEIDRTRIRQILLNLLGNARRFTDSGTVTVAVQQGGRDLVLQVVDTGRGIAEDQLPLIFDEFFQVDYSLSRSHGGAGLGLAITKHFVEAHEGKISVESQLGAGTTFTVTLPIVTTRQRLANLPLDISPDSPRNKQPVLVIDPDPAVASLMNRFFARYTVIPIESPAELDPAIQRHHPVAVVHNNPRDPHRIEISDIPVIECSLPSSMWLVEQLGVLACLPKPVTTPQLLSQIQRLPQIEKILVVDDDLGFVQLVQRSIETLPQPYRVLRAYDGIQALEMVGQNQPDLIVLDIAMPEMNGFEVIDALQKDPATCHIPIILLTATRYVESENEQHTEFVVRKSSGLNPSEVLRCTQAVLEKLVPY